jgi:hypothetical protein
LLTLLTLLTPRAHDERGQRRDERRRIAPCLLDRWRTTMARPHALALVTLSLSLWLPLAGCSQHRFVLEEPVGRTTVTAGVGPDRPLAGEPRVEGRLDVCVGGRDGRTVRYETKGDKIRIMVSTADEMPRLDLVLDSTRGLATLLLDARRQYALLDLDTLAKRRAAEPPGAVVETGESRLVAGRPCDVWRVVDFGYGVEACVATGAPPVDLAAIEDATGFEGPAWLRWLAARGAVPLRVATFDGESPGCVAEILPRPVEASTFVVPEGFSRIGS